MPTNPVRSDEERIRAFHEKLSQPSIVEIDGATVYWREDDGGGRRVGSESPTSEAPLLAALSAMKRGADSVSVSLVCNAPDSGRYLIATGEDLLRMAESAAS